MIRAALAFIGVCTACFVIHAQQELVFRARADAVLVSVSVRARGTPVAGLRAEDFQLLDNGVPQTITSTAGEALPVDVTLVLDTSGSVTGRALERLKADLQQMSDELQFNDRVRLLAFSTRVIDVFGLRPGGAPLPLDRLPAGGATAFYQALAAAVMLVPDAERPQLVFGFSDGLDNASFVDVGELGRLADYSSAAMYIALVPPSLDNPTQATGFVSRVEVRAPYVDQLRAAAARTGGALYVDPVGLPSTFRKVLDDFRTSYVLRYTPRGVDRRGWHDLVVTTPKHAGYEVRARKGYAG